jgi:Novel STAND NTPase 1/Lamin Tail Domain
VKIEAPVFAAPYPGLRPFDPGEAPLFYARGAHIVGMLRILRREHFLAVVGSSGCGKSSLVRAGLVPALDQGFLDGPEKEWRFLLMRPAGAPYANLARAVPRALSPLPGPGETTSEDVLLCEKTLRRGPKGLLDAVLDRLASPKGRVLLLVDQFEEIFRFALKTRKSKSETRTEAERADRQNEALAFVDLLLWTVRQQDPRVYVALTMRSDFLGECDGFRDLPEAVTRCQFLPPRLTWEELKDAIERPPRHRQFGGRVAPDVASNLIAALGDQHDQLPLIQHALLRMWTTAKEDPNRTGPVEITLEHARRCLPEGTGSNWIAGALAQHLDSIYNLLGDGPGDEARMSPRQRIAQRLFCALCRDGGDGRRVRRISSLDEVAAMAGVERSAVAEVVSEFTRPGRNFLVPSPKEDDPGNLALDISHESLIRHWPRLRGWLDVEAESAARYRHLVESARFGDPLTGHALQVTSEWFEQFQPRAAWGDRYFPGEFERASAFLRASQEAARLQEEARRKEEARIEAERIEKEAAKERELDLNKRLVRNRSRALLGVGAVGIVAVVLAVLAWWQRNQALEAKDRAQTAETNAVEERNKAIEAQKKTEGALAEAKSARHSAELAAQEARHERDVSQAARLMAVLGRGSYPTRNEFGALWDLAQSSDDVRMIFLEQLLSARGQAQRIEVRFPYVLQAIVGLETTRRDRVRGFLERHGRPPSEHQEINVACARFGSLLEWDEPAFNDFVGSNFVAAMEKTTVPEELSSLKEALGGFGRRLSEPGAARLAAQIVSATQRIDIPSQLSAFGSALGAWGNKLPEAEAGEIARRLVAAMHSESDNRTLMSLGEALGQLKDKLPRLEAEKAGARLIKSMNSITASNYELEQMGKILAGFAGKLPPEQSLEAVQALLAGLKEATFGYSWRSLGETLIHLMANLPEESAVAPLQQLVGLMEGIKDPYDLAALGTSLDDLGKKLPAEQAAGAAKLMVAAMRTKGPPYPLVSLGNALEKLERHLDAERASEVAKQIVAAAPDAASPEASRAYREALDRYLQRFPQGPAAQEAQAAASLLERKTGRSRSLFSGADANGSDETLTVAEATAAAGKWAAAMDETKDPKRLHTLAGQLIGLGDKLPEPVALQAAKRIVTVMRMTTGYLELDDLGRTLGGIATKLSERSADQLAGELLAEIRKTTRNQDRDVPLRAWVTVTAGFSAERLEKLAGEIRSALSAAEKTEEQNSLMDVLRGLSQFLPEDARTRFVKELIGEMRSIRDYNQVQWRSGMVDDWTRNLHGENAQTVARDLLSALKQSKEAYQRARFVEPFSGLGGELSPALAEETARLFLANLDGSPDDYFLRSFETTLEAVCRNVTGPRADALARDMTVLLQRTTNYSKVIALGTALIGFGDRLSEDQGAIVARRLVAAMRAKQEPYERASLGSLLGGLKEKLSGQEASQAGEILLETMKAATNSYDSPYLARGLGALSRRLPDALVGDATEQIVRRMRGTTNHYEFQELFRALTLFGQRLPDSPARAAAQLLVRAMSATNQLDSLPSLASDLTVLGEKLPPEEAGAAARRLLDVVIAQPSISQWIVGVEDWQKLGRRISPEMGKELGHKIAAASRQPAAVARLTLLSSLASALGEKLPDGDLVELTRQILEAVPTATNSSQFTSLIQTLKGSGARLPPELAVDAAKTVVDAAVKAEPGQQWSYLRAIPDGLMTNVPPDQMSALADKIIPALLQSAGDYGLGSFGSWLGDWGKQLSKSQAAKITQRLVASMRATTDYRKLNTLGGTLAGFGEKLPGEDAAAAISRLIAAMQMSPDSQRHEDMIVALAAQADPSALFSILKSIVCIGDFRSRILAVLEEKSNGVKFDGNLWKAVAWAGREQIDLAKTPRYPITTDFQSSTPGPGPVVINELMTSDLSRTSQSEAAVGAWIELLNRSEQDVDLSGAFLSDTETNLRMWLLPPGTSLAPNAYLVVLTDQLKPAQAGLPTGFTFDRNGGTILLVDRDERTNRILDRLTFPVPREGLSFGRLPDGTTAFQALLPTPGTENKAHE